MGFPAKTKSGETVEIVEKGNVGGTELLRTISGDCYTTDVASGLLVPHEGNATDKAIVAEVAEPEVSGAELVVTDLFGGNERELAGISPATDDDDEKLVSPVEVFGQLLDESAQREMAEAVENLADDLGPLPDEEETGDEAA